MSIAEMESSPLISIVIAVFNGAKTIQSCLDSVRNQSFLNWEVVIVDGGSSDDTVSIIKKNTDMISHWISEDDDGICDAWNKALGRISGNWVYFMGADDRLYSSHTLQCVSEFISKSDTSVDLACGAVEMIHKASISRICVESDQFPLRMLPHQGIFHKSTIFHEKINFSSKFRIRGDYEFLARVNHRHKLKISVIPDLIIASCQSGGLSSSAAARLKCFMETFHIRKKFNLQPYSLGMIHFFFKAIVAHLLHLLGLKI